MIKRPDLFNVQTRKKQLKKLPKTETDPSQYFTTKNFQYEHCS